MSQEQRLPQSLKVVALKCHSSLESPEAGTDKQLPNMAHYLLIKFYWEENDVHLFVVYDYFLSTTAELSS